MTIASATASATDTAAARVAFNDKKYEAALGLAESAIATDASDVKALFIAGASAAKLERVEVAIGYLKRAIVIDPVMISAHLQLGFLYEKTKDLAAARESWKRVVELCGESDAKVKILAKKHLNNLSEP